MKVTIKIECGNAAFDPEPNAELARILAEASRAMEERTLHVGIGWGLYDINGNRVGELKVTR